MIKPVTRFLLKVLLFALPVFILFELMFRLGLWPVITNSGLFDAKVRHIKQQHVGDVKLMAIGSSITLYELKSDLITQNVNMPYYNFASWGIQVSDMRLMLNDYVNEYHPKYVIMCASLGEFRARANESYLNYFNTPHFIRNNFQEYFYFKNYNSIHQLIWRKYFEYPINFDQWGGASLTVKPKDINRKMWDAHDVFPTRYTQANYIALDSMAHFLKGKSVKFIFAQAPIKKSYANAPPYQQRLQTHFDKCRQIVERSGGIYLNYYNTTVFTDSLFVDQYHLQDAGAKLFTKEVVVDLKGLIK
jgi:hypothetical protein